MCKIAYHKESFRSEKKQKTKKTMNRTFPYIKVHRESVS